MPYYKKLPDNSIPDKYLQAEFVEKINLIYHDLEAENYDKSHPEILRFEIPRWKRILAAAKIKKKQKMNVLDVGTGTGFCAYQVLSKFPDAKMRCVDISEKMLMAARKKLINNFPRSELYFEISSADQFEFQPETFDLVTMNSVLHHLPKPIEVFQKAFKSLVTGGLIILGHEPNLRFYSNSSLLRLTERMQNARGIWSKYCRPSRYIRKALEICKIAPRSQNKSLASDVFSELIRKRIINEKDHFKISWIGALVDLHIPRIRSKITPGLPGFDPINLVKEVPQGKIIFIEYYDYLADESNCSVFHCLLNYYLSKRYPGCGAHFSAIYQRCF